MDEYLDVFCENYKPIEPYKMLKNEVHQRGLWHHSFHCFILDKDDNSLFFQLNRKKNNNFQPILTPSSAGHVQAGEQIENGIREVKEELGITVKIDDLTYLGMQKRIVSYENYHDKEFIHVYFLNDSIKASSLKLDKREIKGFYAINIKDGLSLFLGEKSSIKIQGEELKEDEYIKSEIIVTLPDFVEQPKNYYENIFKYANKVCT